MVNTLNLNLKLLPNKSCKGLNLCTTQCPMGIDVASYAHKDGKPIEAVWP